MRTYHVYLFIRLKSRWVFVTGVTTTPTDLWMGHAAEGGLGFLDRIRFPILDRDRKVDGWLWIALGHAGVKMLMSPGHAPCARAQASHCTSLVRFDPSSRSAAEMHLRLFFGPNPQLAQSFQA